MNKCGNHIIEHRRVHLAAPGLARVALVSTGVAAAQIDSVDQARLRLLDKLRGLDDEHRSLVATQLYTRETVPTSAIEGVQVDAAAASQRRTEKLAQRQWVANTFGQAADAWHAFRSGAWNAKSAGQARSYLDKDILPKLQSRPLDNISPKELGLLVGAIENRGVYDIAKKTRKWLKATGECAAYANGLGIIRSELSVSESGLPHCGAASATSACRLGRSETAWYISAALRQGDRRCSLA